MKQTTELNTPSELDLFVLIRESQEIGEFDLFRMAYVEWYGKIPDLNKLENDFDGYLVTGELPFYVRNYCRQFIKERPETIAAIRKQEKRSRFIQRLVIGLLIVFVAAALILA